MSTKVYEAYRLKRRADFWAVARDAHDRARADAQRRIRDLTAKFASAVRSDVPAYAEKLKGYAHWGEQADEVARHSVGHDLLIKLWGEQKDSPYRGPFDFRAVLAVHELRGRVYLRPVYGDPMRGAFEFLAQDARVDDFAYWNNTDRPARVPEAEWSRRGRVWGDMGPAFTFVVAVDAESFLDVDPYMTDALARNRARKAAEAKAAESTP